MKLYQIKDEHENALKEMIEAGFDQETIDDSLAAIKDEFSDKAMSVAAYIKNIKADIIALDTEGKRIAERKRIKTKQVEGLEDYLKHNMLEMDINCFESPLFKISLRKATKVVGEIDEMKLHKDFFITIPATHKVDRRALLAALKIGDVEGAELGEGNRGLSIT